MMLTVLPGELRNPARRSAGPARHGDRLLLREAGQTRQKKCGAKTPTNHAGLSGFREMNGSVGYMKSQDADSRVNA